MGYIRKLFYLTSFVETHNYQEESEYSEDEDHNSMEEDKYYEGNDNSSDNEDICVEESDSNSDQSRPKTPKNQFLTKRKHKLGKHKSSKKKFEGPLPSKHGMNMNATDEYNEAKYYQDLPRNFDRRMGSSYQYPQMPAQGMPFSQIGNPLSTLDNFSMLHPMSNSVVDPSLMMHQKPGQSNMSGMKQEEWYQMMRNYYKNSFFPFSNDLLKDLVNQIDIYVQILIQTLLSTKNVSHQYQLYLLLYEFTKKKEAILKPLKLPKFDVPWVNPDKEAGNPNGEPLKIAPQVSFYQSPILEYAYRIVQKIGK